MHESKGDYLEAVMSNRSLRYATNNSSGGYLTT